MNMQKRGISLLTIIFLLMLFSPRMVRAEATEEIKEGVDSIISGVNLSDWDDLYSSLSDDVRALWGGTSLSSMMSAYAAGESVYAGETLLDGIFGLLKSAVPDMLPMLAGLTAIAILSGFLRAMSDGGITGISDVAGLVCQCFAIAVAMTSFLSLAVLARDTITKTSSFIELAFPILLTLLTASGGIASSGIFQPAMVLLSSGVAAALQDLVIPIILAGGTLGIINNITGRVQLSQLVALSKTASKWMIGLLFTLYFGVTTLQGLTAASFDGISVRTAKFAMDKMIPIVGGMVSGTVDTVLGCAMLVKNAAGVTAIIVAFSIVIVPLMRIAMGMIMFRVAAAITEPIGNERLPKMLASLADVLTYLFAAALTLAVMFIITVGLIIGTGNAAVLGG